MQEGGREAEKERVREGERERERERGKEGGLSVSIGRNYSTPAVLPAQPCRARAQERMSGGERR